VATVAELTARLEKLRATRASGTRSVQLGERRVEYRTDAELAAAIADLERQLAGETGARLHTIRIHASKGLE
jgi:hypothetical protein